MNQDIWRRSRNCTERRCRAYTLRKHAVNDCRLIGAELISTQWPTPANVKSVTFSYTSKGNKEDAIKKDCSELMANVKLVNFASTMHSMEQIIIRWPDDTEVSSELWDEVLESMKFRVSDKVATVRTFAVRALSRFVNDTENVDILELFLETLPVEQNVDVRRTIVFCLPPSHLSSAAIIEYTLDVSESVCKAAYCVIASKFPLQSLRTLILERGLADRSSSVVKECFRMLKNEWLTTCCNGDPLELLKYLDVETYESVGESAMGSLLKAGLIKLQDGQSMRQFLRSDNDAVEGQCNLIIQLMEAEAAFFWRAVCKHLQMEAQVQSKDCRFLHNFLVEVCRNIFEHRLEDSVETEVGNLVVDLSFTAKCTWSDKVSG
ncbi:hypothetical protein FXO37_22415 [Capsicum annuum]|nr:hypothetical protein FXO37_22415 [Capsicum annuum]